MLIDLASVLEKEGTMLHYRTWVFGQESMDHLRSLVAPPHSPPADVWLPLDVQLAGDSPGLPKWRSAWNWKVDSSGHRMLEIEQPGPYILEHLGPRALVLPRGLASTQVRSEYVERVDGKWMVKVPRFYTVVGDQLAPEVPDRPLLTTRDGRTTTEATVGTLDVDASLDMFRWDPELIVGPDGPVVWSPIHFRYRSSVDRKEHLLKALADLQTLPAETPVHQLWCRLEGS